MRALRITTDRALSLLVVIALLILGITSATTTSAVSPSSPPISSQTTQVLASGIGINLGNGLSADFGVDGPIWINQQQSSFQIANATQSDVRVRIKMRIDGAMCTTPRNVAVVTSNDSKKIRLSGSKSGTLTVQARIQASAFARFLLVVDGLPCVAPNDPRDFFGRLVLSLTQLSTG